MASDLKVVEFNDRSVHSLSEKLQDYLDGNNEWELPINEKDVFNISYSTSQANQNQKLYSKVLLVHRKPK